jgi:peptidoglycan/xylan/chitin deacetylase (PgdA/CDA1 family)
MATQTEVVITVDVEFTINDSLLRRDRQPIGAEWVYGFVDGVSHGLGFLLETLDECGLKATFFTEMFNTYRFGDGPIAKVAADILQHGNDVQLHLHPVWRFAANPGLLNRQHPAPHDDITRFSPRDIQAWIADGASIFRRVVGYHPLAFRAGNLCASRPMYPALADANIRMASNVGYAWMRPADKSLRLLSGVHKVQGVTEIPVTTYGDFGSRNPSRLLTITGSSFAEMRSVLDNANAQGVGPIVVLAHPHDLVTTETSGTTGPCVSTPHPLRKRRFRQLCTYLSQNTDRFRVVTFSHAADRWQQASNDDNRLVQASLTGFAARLLENKFLAVLRMT